MCSACVLALDQAIDFREMCINTELKISQAKSLAEMEPDKTEIEALNEEQATSEPDLASDSEYTNVEEIEDPEEEPAEDEAPSDDQLSQEPATESREPAAQDPLSVALGAKIFKELIDQYTGHDRTKKEAPIAKKPRIRKTAVCEQKPRRRANPKTKEERNLIRRAQLRAKPPNFVCDQCGQAFRMSHNLQMHMLRHSRIKNYQCSECPKTFYDAYMRNMHIRIRHRGESPFACRFCSETFAYAGARQKHERLVVNKVNIKYLISPY